jgi:hypothetical protein
MAAELAPRHAYVANDAADTSARNKHALALCPDPVEFVQKPLVVLDPAKLALGARIFFKRPVGRGSDDQVHRAVSDFRKIACVAQRYRVRGGIEWTRPGDLPEALIHRAVYLQGLGRIVGKRQLDLLALTISFGLVGHEIVAVQKLLASLPRHASRLVSKILIPKAPQEPHIFAFGILLSISNTGKIEIIFSVDLMR